MEAAMKRLFTRFGSLDDHLKELLRGATTAASLKIVAALATFGLHLMLGRMLGPEGSGIYFLAFTIITIAATLARFGLDNTLVRFIAAGEAANQPERVRGVYRLGIWITAAVSCALGGLLYASAPWFATSVFKDVALATPLQIMALAVPPFALFVIHAQALQGLKRIRDSITTLSVIAPIATALIGMAIIPMWGVTGAAAGCLGGAIAALAFGNWRWRQWVRFHRYAAPVFAIRQLLNSAVPLFWVGIMNQVVSWFPTIALGMLHDSYQVGLFSAANRTAMLVSFVLVAVNSIAAPKFAAIYHEGDMNALRRISQSTTRLMIIFAIPPSLFFMTFPAFVMGVFGGEFSSSSDLLIILAIGQFVNVATGSVGYLLMMTGNEQAVRKNIVAAVLFALIVGVWLIECFGALGAAISSSLTVILLNLANFFVVRKLLWRHGDSI